MPLVRHNRWEPGYCPLAEVTLPTELFAWMSHLAPRAWAALSYLAAHGGEDGLTEDDLLRGVSVGPLRADLGCGLCEEDLRAALDTLEFDAMLARKGTDGRWRVRWGHVLGR